MDSAPDTDKLRRRPRPHHPPLHLLAAASAALQPSAPSKRPATQPGPALLFFGGQLPRVALHLRLVVATAAAAPLQRAADDQQHARAAIREQYQQVPERPAGAAGQARTGPAPPAPEQHGVQHR